MKGEALDEAGVKELLVQITQREYPPPKRLMQMILTWAVAKAEAERAEWQRDWTAGNPHVVEYAERKDADWLQTVLNRIGWKDE